jgi:hypothetical protein
MPVVKSLNNNKWVKQFAKDLFINSGKMIKRVTLLRSATTVLAVTLNNHIYQFN